jgi:2-polyprenyl-3-methyl-5-hydroxy-6-metoxy-1,4-benzoquinol methylase
MSQWKENYAPEDLETVLCPVCGNGRNTRITTEFSLSVVKCQACGLLYVNPRPRDSEKNYWAPTRASMEKKYGAIFEGRKAHDRDSLYRSHLDILARYQPIGKFLDVGTHCGFFLRHTRGRGWDAEGIEPSPILGELAQEKFGLKVKTGSLESAAFPNEAFDVITLLDVIEHLHDVRAMLKEIRRIAKSNGVFFIKTPNGTYNYFKHLIFHNLLRRHDYDCFDAREHVAAYTVPTLTRLLNETGWQVIASMPSAPVQTYGSHAVKIVGRNILYTVARAQHALTGQPGPFATDIILLAKKSSPPL